MRIVLIGVSHWHTPFYADPVLAMTDATIVGVDEKVGEATVKVQGETKEKKVALADIVRQ